MLANKGKGKDGTTFIATRVPGTKCIIIINRSNHKKDPLGIGFQFERLVTGEDMSDVSNLSSAEHIHTMKIGDKAVLFRAEVDAIDNDNVSPVEIKVSPQLGTSSVMFQMISSGSLMLCKGTSKTAQNLPKLFKPKFRNAKKVLYSVAFSSLSEVVPTRGIDVTVLEKNIVDAMNAIQSQLLGANDDDGSIYKLSFSGANGSLSLEKVMSQQEVDELNPFPPRDIARRLIG